MTQKKCRDGLLINTHERVYGESVHKCVRDAWFVRRNEEEERREDSFSEDESGCESGEGKGGKRWCEAGSCRKCACGEA